MLTRTRRANSLEVTSAGAITDAPASSLRLTNNASLAGASIAIGGDPADSTNLAQWHLAKHSAENSKLPTYVREAKAGLQCKQ